jgi:hypothetical protein
MKKVGGKKMEYQKPKTELIWLNEEDIVRTSLTDEGEGDDGNIGGDGSQPWE